MKDATLLTVPWPASLGFRHHSMSSLNNNRINFSTSSSPCYRSNTARGKISLCHTWRACVRPLFRSFSVRQLWVPNVALLLKAIIFYDFGPLFHICYPPVTLTRLYSPLHHSDHHFNQSNFSFSKRYTCRQISSAH